MSITILNPLVEFHNKGFRIYEEGKKEEYFILYTIVIRKVSEMFQHTFYLKNGLKVIVLYDERKQDYVQGLKSRFNTMPCYQPSEQTSAPVQASIY